MGAATPAVVRYPSPLTLLRPAQRLFCWGYFSVSNQGNFSGICLAPRRLTPGVCPIKT
jgi:hypothetical protein